jgi:DNA-binding MarR family transcriptional regulator
MTRRAAVATLDAETVSQSLKTLPGADAATGRAAGIFHALRRLVRVMNLSNRELAERMNLTLPQLFCLDQLAQGGAICQRELAQRVSLTQATVTGIVDRLETRGLVERRRESTDRRVVSLHLTEQGDKIAAMMPALLDQCLLVHLSQMPVQQQTEISDALGDIVDFFQSPSEMQ